MPTQDGQSFDSRLKVGCPGNGRRVRNGVLRFSKGDEAVQRVMQPRGSNKRSREIGAHLPVDTGNLSGLQLPNKSSESRLSQLNRPLGIVRVANDEGSLTESMDPLGEIVEILTIAVPFQTLIEWLANITFFERFSDPETTCGRMVLPGFIIETADPSTSRIVAAISPEHLMYPINQISRAVVIFFIAGPVEQFKEVAYCECVSPQVSLLILR
jgi:hypothetical protein